MATDKEIKLDITKAQGKVFNLKHNKWFFLIPTEETYPFDCFLKSKECDDLYLGSSLASAPWLWGTYIDRETGEEIDYKLSKADIIERFKTFKDPTSIFTLHDLAHLLILYIGDEELYNAYNKFSKGGNYD